MQYLSAEYRIRGVAPLLLHNGWLADPQQEIPKALKQLFSQRDKTDADLAEMARLEWYGALYLHDGKPYLPGDRLEATLIESAKKKKKGPNAKAGLLCEGNFLPRPGAAARCYRQALAEAGQLEATTPVRRQIGGLQLALAGALMKFRDPPASREAAEAAWKTAEELGDRLLLAQVNLQLGALDLWEGRSGVLSRRFQASDHLEGLGDPASLAWPWGAVAAVAAGVKRSHEAGAWYHPLVVGRQKKGKAQYVLATAKALDRLVDLLRRQRQYLAAARQLAEQALALKQHVIRTLSRGQTW